MELKSKYGAEGFEILAFPCRQFGKQEFAEPEKIREFADKHNANFEIMDICEVNGPNTHPVFVYCKWNAPPDAGFVNTKNLTKLGSIGWNFGKFLMDRNSGVCRYYGPSTPPSDIENDIQKALNGEMLGFRRTEEGQPIEPGSIKLENEDDESRQAKRGRT